MNTHVRDNFNALAPGFVMSMTGSGAQFTPAANTAYYARVEVQGSMVITSINWNLETSSGNMNLGIYNSAYARQWRFPLPIIDALEHQYAPFSNNVYEPLAGVIHLATWRARAREAQLNERALAVTFPGEVGEVLDLDIDMVLQQDPFDWSAHT